MHAGRHRDEKQPSKLVMLTTVTALALSGGLFFTVSASPASATLPAAEGDIAHQSARP